MKKWLVYTLIALVLLIGAGIVLFDVILEGIMVRKLESVIQQEKDRIYDYQFDGIELKFIAGDVILQNLEIAPRNHVIDSLAAL